MKNLPQILKVELGNIKTKAELQEIVNAELEIVQTILKVETVEERENAHSIISNAKKIVKYVGEERMKVTRILDAKKAEFMQTEKEIVFEVNEAVERGVFLVKEYDEKIIKQRNEELRIAKQKEQDAEIERQKLIEEQKKEQEIDVWDSVEEPRKIIVERVEIAPGAKITEIPKGIRMVSDFEIVDFSKVPDSYKIVDIALVKEAMKTGQEIAGIKFFKKPQTTF